MLAALLVVLSFSSASSAAPGSAALPIASLALVAPPASEAPPATGEAIPPDAPPEADAPAADPAPAPAPAPGDGEDLFQTTETPDGVDSSRRESEIYGARIDGLQGDVDELKERIFRSKARLSVLKETVLHGVLAGSRVIIVHRNLMGSQFRLTKLAVILDGAQIYARSDDSGTLDQEDEVVVLDGNIVPGPHTITIELTYQGQGFGVFSYLNGYTFESRSSHNFTAPENGAVRLMSAGYEKGNLTTEMKDRPSVDWQETALDASGKPLPQAQRKKSKKSASKSKAQQKPAAKKPSDEPGVVTGEAKPAQTPKAQTPKAQTPKQTPKAQPPSKDPAPGPEGE
jgi:hypothetical protein